MSLTKSATEVAMAPKLILEYAFQIYLKDKEKDRYHISADGGDVHPYFMMTTHFSEDEEKRIMNFMYVNLLPGDCHIYFI